MNYVTLAEIIAYAYATNTYCINGPAWLNNHTELYDVTAKAPPEAALDDIRLMLRALLAERFKLVLHREQKPVVHFELVVAKNGPKLRPAETDAEPSRMTYRPGIIASAQFPLSSLAELITRQMHTLVVDGTGLKGLFDIRLEFEPDPALLERPEGQQVGQIGHGPSIFTAVQEQLGLRLESRKTPVEMIVVDRAEKTPAEN